MSVRCPACGFESAPGAKWCDYCKEPFEKKRKQDEVDPALFRDDASIRRALSSDQIPTIHLSPLVRQLSIVLLLFFLVAGLFASVLVFFGARDYHGPGEEIQLGNLQIIPVNKSDTRRRMARPTPPSPPPPPPPPEEEDTTPVPFPDWMKRPASPTAQPPANSDSQKPSAAAATPEAESKPKTQAEPSPPPAGASQEPEASE